LHPDDGTEKDSKQPFFSLSLYDGVYVSISFLNPKP